MKQTLQLRLSQHLALTPQLQQSIRLLQLSTLELNQEIEKFLQDNPLLEREDLDAEARVFSPSSDAASTQATDTRDSAPEPEQGEAAAQSEWQGEGGTSYQPRSDDDDTDYSDIQAASTTLRDHLNAQLSLTQLSERDKSLVRFLIEALDDDGYLTQSLEELTEMLPAELEIDLEDLQIALKHLQHLDPSGVGARNPQECLALQLMNDADTPCRRLAMDIVVQHLDQLAARDYPRIKKALQCSDAELRDANALILSLNPRPAAQYAPVDTRYIIPDVTVRKLRGSWVCSLNPDAMPKLKINRLYADILQGQRGNSPASCRKPNG